MKKVNLIMCLIGLIGMVIISVVCIADSKSSDLVSAIPATILFSSLFIAGYLKDKKDN